MDIRSHLISGDGIEGRTADGKSSLMILPVKKQTKRGGAAFIMHWELLLFVSSITDKSIRLYQTDDNTDAELSQIISIFKSLSKSKPVWLVYV